MSDTVRFSLGAATLGSVPAEGCVSAGQQAPEAWLEAFAAQAGAEVLLGLFRSGRAGCDFVLQYAPRAELRLDQNSKEPIVKVSGQLISALQRFGTRPHSAQGTAGLTITGTESSVNGALLVLLLPALHGAGAGITQLNFSTGLDQQMLSYFLLQAASALPNLRSLSFTGSICSLPPPSAIPKLTELCIQGSRWRECNATAEAVCDSVTALLPQITALELSNKYIEEDQPQTYALSLIFTPQSITHTLTRYSTTDVLTDQLVSLLVKHAPSLEQLTVRTISLDTDHSSSTWGVKQLVFKGWKSSAARLRSFGCLPASTAGQVEVAGLKVLHVNCAHEGPSARALLRLNEWQFKDLQACNMPLSSHAPAILNHLAALQAPAGTELNLSHYHALFSEESDYESDMGTDTDAGSDVGTGSELDTASGRVQALAAGLAALQGVVRVHLALGCSLTDGVLGEMLQLGPHVHSLTVRGLKLQTEQHAGAAWPWARLVIEPAGYGVSDKATLDLGVLARCMPDPAACSAAPVAQCEVVKVDKLTEAEAVLLQARLPHLMLACSKDARSNCPDIHVECKDISLSQLSTQLSVLRAMEFKPLGEQGYVQLALRDCSLTSDVVAALSGLPEWRGCLNLNSCKWPCEPAVYTQLAHRIPTSYLRWNVQTWDKKALGSICQGVNQRRQGLGLPPLKLSMHSLTWAGLKSAGVVGEHVVYEY